MQTMVHDVEGPLRAESGGKYSGIYEEGMAVDVNGCEGVWLIPKTKQRIAQIRNKKKGC